jgi:uncharacterized membrane protein
MNPTEHHDVDPGPAARNIERIARLEHKILEERSATERMGDAIGAFSGTMTFVLLHIFWFAAWTVINTGLIPGIRPFDPYPFLFLSLAVSMEAVLLSTFVLMKQNRMSKRSDRRNELNLQIDLLAEREATKMLQMLQSICNRLGLKEEAADAEVVELSKNTKVESIARELERQMPPE